MHPLLLLPELLLQSARCACCASSLPAPLGQPAGRAAQAQGCLAAPSAHIQPDRERQRQRAAGEQQKGAVGHALGAQRSVVAASQARRCWRHCGVQPPPQPAARGGAARPAAWSRAPRSPPLAVSCTPASDTISQAVVRNSSALRTRQGCRDALPPPQPLLEWGAPRAGSPCSAPDALIRPAVKLL